MVKNLWILVAFCLLVSSVSAVDYCLPPGEMTQTIDHQGTWYNITLTSPNCYICVDNGAMMGDVECNPCPIPIPVTQNFNRDQRIVDPLTWVKNWFNDIRHVGE